jgi:hypothetical protein
MKVRRRLKWMHFGEFFEAVSIKGIDEIIAAETLLEALRTDVQAFGYRRRYIYDSEESPGTTRELLPRDIQPQRVPIDLWQDSSAPDRALTSHWTDSDEKPHQHINVDWLSGTLQSTVWVFDPLELVWRDYHALRIEEREALEILKELAGVPTRRRGAAAGPRDPLEREQVEKAVAMIRAGDLRRLSIIAGELTAKDLSADEFQNQKRRISAGIRAELRATE